MEISLSKLRGDIYKHFDRVAESGEPLRIRRKGQILRVVPERKASRLSRLSPHDCLTCDSDAIVHLDWSEEWHDDLP